MNELEARGALKIWESLDQRTDEICDLYIKVGKAKGIHMELDNFYFTETKIVLEIEESWNYGGHDRNRVGLPIELLWSEDTEGDLKKIKAEEDEKKRLQREELARKIKEAEHRQYLELKEKYGD